ncbi:hypothetical protein ACOHYD_13355 [Desulfobacterota bacterium M19]
MNKLLLDFDRKQTAEKFLNAWARCFLELEGKYSIQKNEVNNRDYDFLKLIGQSIYNINSFNSLIISTIEKDCEQINDEIIKNEYLDFCRYLRFFNSLVASKIKFFFFRETPIKNTNNPFLKIDFQILKCANELVKHLTDDKKSLNKLYVSASKYFYLQTLLYSFIYHSRKEKGIFLKFDYKIYDFKKIKKKLSRLYKEAKDEKDVRLLGSNIIAIIANHYLDNNKKCSVEYNNDLLIKKPDCYDKLFFKLSIEKIFIEPLTYHLSDVLWKIDGMIHDDDEFLNQDCSEYHQKNVVNGVKKFVIEYLDLCEDMYNKQKIDYKSIFDIEKKYFSNLYPYVFNQTDVHYIKEKFITINQDKKIYKNGHNIEIPFEKKDSNLVDIFEKVRDSGERGFKIETLIEVLNFNELIALLACYAKQITKNDFLDDSTEFVGFYKSGVFLGHMVNLLYGKPYKTIWLFKSKPYVATHPIHRDSNENDFNKIIIFDECLKTGFTYSLYESYLTRNLFNSHLSTSLYSLFNFTYYKQISFNNHVNFHSLIKLNDINYPINITELNLYSKILENQKSISFSIYDLNFERLIRRIKYNHKYENGAERVDLTFLLSNTTIILSLCEKFVDKIINKNIEKKPIMLFTASSDGEVLVLITAFLLKRRFNKKIVFFDSSKNKNDFFNVAIDLSVVSGFSLGYALGVKTRHYCDKNEIKKHVESFDLICTIVSKHSNLNNIYTLYNI